MKLILSSCDFDNENSKRRIIENIDKPLSENKVLFIPNEKATKESINSDKYYKRLESKGFSINNIYIFDEENANKFIDLDIDIIYVSGGNTFATMNKIKRTNFDKAIINYINKGVIYIGGSCGAHIVSKNIEHIAMFDENYCDLVDMNGLDIFDGIIIPHCEAEEYNLKLREDLYKKLVKDDNYKVYKLTNDETLLVTDSNIKIIK